MASRQELSDGCRGEKIIIHGDDDTWGFGVLAAAFRFETPFLDDGSLQ